MADPRRLVAAPLAARLSAPAAVLASAAAFFGLCLAQSLTAPWTADTADTALQGWALVHGHLLLHGWWEPDVTFYTFDAPLYGLCMRVFGFGSTALHVAGALLYTLVFLAAAWLAKGDSHGRQARLRVALTALMLSAPLFRGALLGTLMLVPDHCGTVVFALVSFALVSQASGRRWASGAPWALCAVLTLGQFGDATVRYVAVPALLLVCLLDSLIERRVPAPRLRFAMAAIASVPVSMLLRLLMKSQGAYYMAEAHTRIAPTTDWGWHLEGTWLSLLSLFGVRTDFPGVDAAQVAGSLVGGFVLLCGLGGLAHTAVRWTSVDVADRLLAVSVVLYLGAYAFSGVTLRGGGGGYEFVGVLVLLGTLAARTLARLRLRLPSRLPGPTRSSERLPVTAVTAVAGLAALTCLFSGTGLFVVSQNSPDQALAAWLEQHHLSYGLSGYWNAASTTVYSGGRVQLRQILAVPGGFVPYAWGAQQQWYEPARYDARFVVAEASGPQYTSITAAQAEASFGTPSAVYRVDGFTVLVYPYNLLTRGRPPHLKPGA